MLQQQSNIFSPYIHHIDRDNNMGLVRYILAFGVLISHFNILCGAQVPWVISNINRVGGFFALSGFVLIGSLFKGRSFKTFILKRAIRILPSYFFVVIFFSILMSLISTLSPVEYFTDSGYWKYLAANLCFLNFLHPTLPGVFTDFDMPAVNGALWTMKVEWQLSLSAPIIVWLCRRYNINIIKAMIFILIFAIFYRLGFEYLFEKTDKKIYEILGRQFGSQTFFFYGGIIIYCNMPWFLKNLKKIISVILLVYIISPIWHESTLYFLIFQPFVITLLVLSISLTKGNYSAKIDKGHNISYEIYLCHFPIMQLVAYFNIVELYGVAIALTCGIIFTIIAAIITYVSLGRIYRLPYFKSCFKD